uniref:Gamma-tubulin complex component n=3 Tax=Aegilops tauschii subsp. strangulata TaxID=200361 RepID=A0A453TDM9_AEGTS
APPAAGDTPPSPPVDAESSASTEEESRWLAALSESELDLLVSLKLLAVKRAETSGRPHLADAFDLRTLRALGVVLLEDFKQRLREETSLDAILLDRLALSRDPDADCTVSCNSSDSKVFRQHSKDQPIKPSGVKKKRKRTHDGRHGEA